MLSVTRIDAAAVDLVRRAHVLDWLAQEPPRHGGEGSAALQMVANLVERVPSDSDRPLWILDALAALLSLESRVEGALSLFWSTLIVADSLESLSTLVSTLRLLAVRIGKLGSDDVALMLPSLRQALDSALARFVTLEHASTLDTLRGSDAYALAVRAFHDAALRLARLSDGGDGEAALVQAAIGRALFVGAEPARSLVLAAIGH